MLTVNPGNWLTICSKKLGHDQYLLVELAERFFESLYRSPYLVNFYRIRWVVVEFGYFSYVCPTIIESKHVNAASLSEVIVGIGEYF